ncbi:aminotransferase class I and II [Gemmatirosa kalamazoonensis]|uniref:Aminotransferase n=1 Tax=Gemmatirosa kalamazoonensis TaxID=861299 RepID=W0RF49_9BACT|nr:aminotransferase class I/II-fold pyridoxal phosphate-dependent enzyme [Gemmatirosa kalamazoonensis]AHG89072.1 aminotransferase class I and II [Gemmatirosa kalamazoonensis]
MTLVDALPTAPRLSRVADRLYGSQILGIAAEIRAMVAAGASVCNLTVGDFAPAEFRIPKGLERRITDALARGETNYPPSNGMPALREAVSTLYRERLGLAVDPASVVVCGGSRPAIYAAYRCVVDPGDKVVYPTPSWNNDAYVILADADGEVVDCDASTAFLPTRATLERAVRGARLLALNSPLNPAGTAFDAESLGDICDLVLEENARRAASGERPLYVMYDQVYWMLTFGGLRHVSPVGLRPEMARYTIFVDGVSKALAATGLRVGWVVPPADLAGKFSDFLGHVGAWAPRAEQVAVADFLRAPAELDAFAAEIRAGVEARLDALHDGLAALGARGLPVEASRPMGAIYLSARFMLNGRRTPEGATLGSNEDIRRYLLGAAGLALVPFQAFGVARDDGWFRLSVGAVSLGEIAAVLPRLETAIRAIG